MRELIKVEKLRLKMPANYRPTPHEMRDMVIGADHVVTESRIDKMKSILEHDFKNNIAFLNNAKKRIKPVTKK